MSMSQTVDESDSEGTQGSLSERLSDAASGMARSDAQPPASASGRERIACPTVRPISV
jgi:hypothetical protein